MRLFMGVVLCLLGMFNVGLADTRMFIYGARLPEVPGGQWRNLSLQLSFSADHQTHHRP
jgi:hypothetical protein